MSVLIIIQANNHKVVDDNNSLELNLFKFQKSTNLSNLKNIKKLSKTRSLK